jgi:hypothetical protein
MKQDDTLINYREGRSDWTREARYIGVPRLILRQMPIPLAENRGLRQAPESLTLGQQINLQASQRSY